MAIRIMYVDDEKDLCEVFCDIFSSDQFIIETYTDPLKAIDAAAKNPPDVAILDFRLPNTTGDILAHSMKGNFPKVLITGDLAVSTSYSFEKIFTKPFKEEEIIIFLEKINNQKN